MSKKVAFGTKPAPEKPAINPDQWVQNRGSEKIKRLTMDVPASLHTRLKVSCAMRGTTIADEVRALLEKHYREDVAV